MLSRRSFLATVGALAAGAACRNGSQQQVALAATRRRLERVGIQLYSVRGEMRRDMPATIARLAEIGYREVEFAGYFGRTPQQVKDLLAQHTLTAPSTHVSLEAVRDNFDRTADEAIAIGHQYLTVPSLPASVRQNLEGWRNVAREFNRAGERARARGLRLAFHNHDTEFRLVEGVVPFDLLVRETDPSLVSFQMDVYWTVRAGFDPLAYIRQHPTRFTMLHIKDSAGPPNHQQTDVGAGTIDFAAILRLDAQQRATVRHAFIEHDQPADPMAFAKKSFDYLSTLEY